MSGDSNRYCVVIDTNIWRSELLLKSPMGRTLIYTLGRQGGRIGLPEVVEKELPDQIVEAGLEAANALNKHSRVLDTLNDSIFLSVEPTRGELSGKVEARLAELEPILIRVPFSLEHATAALDMVIAKAPPNGPKNQQFKDSAIWQAVLTLSEEYAVHFVTNDRAFLADRNVPSKGLAPNLEAESDGGVAVHCDLGSCLSSICEDIPTFDKHYLISTIAKPAKISAQAEAAGQQMNVREVLDTTLKVFQTEDRGRLAVDYTVTIGLDPVSDDDNRIDCTACVRGSCYFDGANIVTGNFIEHVAIDWKTSGGYGRYWRSFDEDVPFPFRRPFDS